MSIFGADKVAIVIPSSGRADNVFTLQNLSKALYPYTYLAVRDDECEAYAQHRHPVNQLWVPGTAIGPGKKRQAIVDAVRDKGYRYLIMADDDFRFFRRVKGRTNLLRTSPEECVELFQALRDKVKHFGFAGVSARGGNNHVAEDYKEVGRMHGLYGVDLELLKKYNLRFDDLPLMEDFNLTLNLLRRGYPNCILYKYAFDQFKSNAPGGCSSYRTPDLQMEAALGLEEAHYPFVKAVRKDANNWEGFGGRRWDVTVYWQKAYLASDLK